MPTPPPKAERSSASSPARAFARSLFRLPERVGWRDHAVGAALAFAYFVWLLATARSLGFPRDEGVYFRAASDYVGWWRALLDHGEEALKQGAIDSAWGYNHEHPVLMKTLFGVSWYLLHVKWHLVTDASTAYRIPAMATAGAALWITYVFGARAYSRRAGLVAAVLLGAMPNIFFHAHLACFDVPVMTAWILCVYVHWRAQDRRTLAWTIAAGVVFGLALETKHNGWFLPAVLVPYTLFVHRREIGRGLRVGRVSIPSSLVSMAVLGPIVFFALWPYLWNDTLARLQWYFEFHLNHEYYNMEFLGRNYFGPPSPKAYLPVMVLATVPTVTLVLFGVGAFDRAAAGMRRLVAWGRARFHLGRGVGRGAASSSPPPARAAEPRDRLETDLLIFLSIAVAMGPFFLSRTPIFGGTKHWLPAYPGLALFAGLGFERVTAAMRRSLAALDRGGDRWGDRWRDRWRWPAAQAALFAAVTLGPLAITAHSHPFGLSTYVPLVGGTAGGATLGLNRQFWGYTTEDAATEYLNPRAPRGATVFIDDTTWDAWGHMQEEGRVRGDLHATLTPSDSQIALVQHELHMSEVDYSIWTALGTVNPAYVVAHDGVPIVSIYRRP
jgi:4-amino-4-deoxy-L-arabinose transferase-like glycosyltransferase